VTADPLPTVADLADRYVFLDVAVAEPDDGPDGDDT
jgi:hypothetical protein